MSKYVPSLISPRLFLCGALLLQGAVFNIAFAENKKPLPLQDLRYGEILYTHYQQDYFAAATRLLMARATIPISKQGDEPELLLGALYILYGLEDAAAEIFERMSTSDAVAKHTRDQAWFYLGKLRYAQQDYAAAVAAFEKTGEKLPNELAAERTHLLTTALLQQRKTNEAIALLESFTGPRTWQRYARLNLGFTLLANSRQREAKEVLAKLLDDKSTDNESHALRDKAHIALGYDALKRDHLDEAVNYFSRVTLSGSFAPQALLGMGWAYRRQGDAQSALQYWAGLIHQYGDERIAQEAWIAIPETLEKSGMQAAALTHYENARQHFSALRLQLEKAQRELIENGMASVLRPATRTQETAQTVWADLDENNLAAASQWREILADARLQRTFRNYQEILQLKIALQTWRESISAFSLMLEERQRNYTLQADRVSQKQRTVNLESLRAQFTALQKILAQNTEVGHLEVVANAREKRLQNYLQRVEKNINLMESSAEDVSVQKNKYRLLRGLLLWNIGIAFPERRWEIEKQLKFIDSALERAEQQQNLIHDLKKITPTTFDEYQERIDALDARLADLLIQMDTVAMLLTKNLEDILQESLRRQKESITTYEIRAGFAVARLSDEMMRARDRKK